MSSGVSPVLVWVSVGGTLGRAPWDESKGAWKSQAKEEKL